MDYFKESLKLHKEKKGKIEITPKVQLRTQEDLSLAYTPGVAAPCTEIAKDGRKVYDYTSKGNLIAVVTDGSAVLGLGNIGAKAALPVMEGKAIIFKRFGNVDAFPILIDSQDTEEIIRTVKNISPGFGGINLEDISAPRCFEVEERLKDELDIPVFHDDQHGTAVVILAALINSLKVVGKDIGNINVVISGAGAAGIATANLLFREGVRKLLMIDSKGIISRSRPDLNRYKRDLSEKFNMAKEGSLKDALENADVFIGVSAPGIATKDMIRSMAKDPIVFSLANPIPEITPEEAYEGGAKIVGTGRSDYPNQVNNSLAFPGIFRGALDIKAKRITEEMKIAAAYALAGLVKNPSKDKVIPKPFDEGIAEAVAEAVKSAYKQG